jgi:hypothetical protein
MLRKNRGLREFGGATTWSWASPLSGALVSSIKGRSRERDERHMI